MISGVKAPQPDDDDDDDDIDDEEPDGPPSLPNGLSYVTGANHHYLYNNYGVIYELKKDKETGTYSCEEIDGGYIDGAIAEYAQKAKETEPLWDISEDSDNITYKLTTSPTYLGGNLFRLVHVDMLDREAYLLLGMDIVVGDFEWKVYYDSLAGLGTAPADLDFSKLTGCSMVGYQGKLYLISDGEVYSCTPSIKGSVWEKAASLPAKLSQGSAIVQNGKLYYLFGIDEGKTINYSIYRFDGTAWEVAGTLPYALYESQAVVETGEYDDWFEPIYDYYPAIPCALGITKDGILFGGWSFDGLGDTFLFNTETGQTEALEYSLWGRASESPVYGTTVGSKLYALYTDDMLERSYMKTIPVTSGYVSLKKTVKGDGTGSVVGGGSYAKGDASTITITPDEGCFVYSASSEGTDPALDLKAIKNDYAKNIAKRTGTITTTYKAEKNGKLTVNFGRISSEILLEKEDTQEVGTRKIYTYTDGTFSEVSWKSKNTKYAVVNKDGTITFKKAGIGKTVDLVATAVDNPKVSATIKISIISRESKKFTWSKKKLTTKQKVQIDSPLAKTATPKNLKATVTKGKVSLSWKAAKGVNGYLILRKTGSGRFVQIGKVASSKKAYIDKKAKKGKKYEYLVVGFKKDTKRSSIKISNPSNVVKATGK